RLTISRCFPVSVWRTQTVSEMNTTTAAADGRPRRKTLSDQLDRLDGVIDDLSDGLNQAVSHAVERGVGTAVEKAVQGVLQAALASPEVARQLALATPAAPPAEQEGATPGEDRGFLGGVLERASAGPTAVAPGRGSRGPRRRGRGRLVGGTVPGGGGGLAQRPRGEPGRPTDRPLQVARAVLRRRGVPFDR